MIRFERHPNNLYVYKPDKRSIKNQPRLQLLNTVEENKSFYTQRQFDQAKRARDLYHALGTPSLHDFKAMLRMNTMANNPVTSKDIKIAEKRFGSDIGALKVKTTRRAPLNLTVVDESEDDSDDNNDLTVVNESKHDSHEENEEVPAGEPDDDPIEVLDEDEQSSVEESNPSTNNDKEVSNEEEEIETAMKTRSGRVIKPPSKLTMVNHLFTQAHRHQGEYLIETARIIAMVMCCVNDMAVNPHKQNWQFIQTYSLAKGLKKFGQRGHDAAFGEMKQLHNRVVFVPTSIDSLTSLERKGAMESLS